LTACCRLGALVRHRRSDPASGIDIIKPRLAGRWSAALRPTQANEIDGLAAEKRGAAMNRQERPKAKAMGDAISSMLTAQPSSTRGCA
jgi:hypothetical protein